MTDRFKNGDFDNNYNDYNYYSNEYNQGNNTSEINENLEMINIFSISFFGMIILSFCIKIFSYIGDKKNKNIKMLNNYIFINENKVRNNELCCICLEELNENVVMIKCHHIYHKKCIDEWFLKKKNCPLCNINI